jgi:hypothetical protein
VAIALRREPGGLASEVAANGSALTVTLDGKAFKLEAGKHFAIGAATLYSTAAASAAN